MVVRFYFFIFCIFLSGCKTPQHLTAELDKFTNTILEGLPSQGLNQAQQTTTSGTHQKTNSNSASVVKKHYPTENDETKPEKIRKKNTPTEKELCTKVQQGDREAILTALNKRIFCEQPEIEIPLEQTEIEIPLEQTEIEIPLEQTEEKAVKPDSSEHSNEEICVGVKMKNREFIKLALMKKLRC